MFRDQLGSVRGVVEGTDWVERGVYRPFGESARWVDPAEEPESHNYIGERRDETGLMYLNARYYDPTLGHFLSPDWFPVEMPGVGPHRYHYSLFDPINLRDPNGNAPWLLIPFAAAFMVAPDPVNDETGQIPGGIENVLTAVTPFVGAVGTCMSASAIECGGAVATESIGVMGDVARGAWNAGSGLLRGIAGQNYEVRNSFNALNEGPLSPGIANTFRSGTYSEVILTEPTVLYRVISEDGNPAGGFWSRTRPEGPLQSVIDSALDQNWGNRATRVVVMEVPSGTRVFEGVAAPQRGLVGGGNQIYFDPEINPLDPDWIR